MEERKIKKVYIIEQNWYKWDLNQHSKVFKIFEFEKGCNHALEEFENLHDAIKCFSEKYKYSSIERTELTQYVLMEYTSEFDECGDFVDDLDSGSICESMLTFTIKYCGDEVYNGDISEVLYIYENIHDSEDLCEYPDVYANDYHIL